METIEEVEYVKIDKNFLLKQWNRLNDKIKDIEKIYFDNNYPTQELEKLRNSLQDLSFIISKTIPL